MAHWLLELDVADIWETAEDDMKNFLGKLIPRMCELSLKLESGTDFKEELAFIIQKLKDFKDDVDNYEDNTDAFYEFNDIWSEFYDWCDHKPALGYSLCWVKTF